MATGGKGGRTRCITCGKDNKATFTCRGCLQDFCYNHITDHRQQLSKQLDDIEVTRDLFRQTLTQHIQQPNRHPSIQQINDWEYKSIKKIQQIADEARQTLFQCTIGYVKQIEVDLNKLTEKLRESRKENDYFETDLRQWNEELNRLTKELSQPSNVYLQEEFTPLVNKISIYASTSTPMTYVLSTPVNRKFVQNGVTVAGGNGAGNVLNQLYKPMGLYVNNDQTIYVANAGNHRVIEWKLGAISGRVVAGGNGQGHQTNQLNGPRDVILHKETDSLIIADQGNKRIMRWSRQNSTHGEILIRGIDCHGLTMDKDGYLYLSDYNKHEIRRWKIGDTHGTVVAGGNGQGDRVDQLNNPMYISVDKDYSIYISDYGNRRVMKWMKGAKEGIVVAGGQGFDSGSNDFHNPYGVAVDQLGTVYAVDCRNNQVIRCAKGATPSSVVVGGNGKGKGANQLFNPVALSFDQQGNLYVTDHGNHRIQKFNVNSN